MAVVRGRKRKGRGPWLPPRLARQVDRHGNCTDNYGGGEWGRLGNVRARGRGRGEGGGEGDERFGPKKRRGARSGVTRWRHEHVSAVIYS